MSEPVDARGLSCPQPVIMAREAMQSATTGFVQIIVDAAAARDNISRLAGSAGWTVAVEHVDDAYILTLNQS